MQRGEARARLEHDLPQLEERHRAGARVLLEIGADQVLEHEERHGAGDPPVDDVGHVGVIETGQRPGLLDERCEDPGALDLVGVRERVRLGDLEDEEPVRPRLAHEPHAANAALAERLHELVAFDDLRFLLLGLRRRRRRPADGGLHGRLEERGRGGPE